MGSHMPQLLFISTINIIFLILFIRQITIFLLAFWTHKTGVAPFKSTETSVIKTFFSQYSMPNTKPIYDLGSGSGKALFTIAHFTNNQLVGIEKNFLLHLIAQARAIFSLHRNRITFINSDVFDVNFKDVSNIYLYMSPKANKLLQKKFETELKKGSYIFALRFELLSKHFTLTQTIQAKYPLYIYKKKS